MIEKSVSRTVCCASAHYKFYFLYVYASSVYCIDAKLQFDDNAAFRHQDIFAYGQEVDQDVLEKMAEQNHLNYIRLSGNIGCLVNGAGLAMATMDLISQQGALPANFLDVGGMAMKEQISNAFRIIACDKNVKAVLVNIFGGIVDCEVVAKALEETLGSSAMALPIVVRLEGTNAQNALNVLSAGRLPVTTARDMDDAVKKVVALLPQAEVKSSDLNSVSLYHPALYLIVYFRFYFLLNV
ncbi:unnamed protein product [Soboliphyme baturini]|uniref:Ligase_CoA domain-containing protein n=1 Tax=Soboliphyme baturini TaxID=241478 RepID=A0A183ILV4_9BILA|nr:unnamed protein product [Soboliphyme baturini]